MGQVGSCAGKVRAKNPDFYGLPYKNEIFGSNFWPELDTKIKSPILEISGKLPIF
jgi:hypothetical protein